MKKIHMVGIGGAGMCPLAEVLLSRGHRVTGSDRSVSESTWHLEKLGVEIQYNHEPNLIAGSDLLVYSSAVPDNNPERVYATEHGIAVMRRAEVLGDVMRSSFTVCVSGTHGKTTTTSLIGTVLTDADVFPTVLVGGMLKSAGSHAIVGGGNVIVAEADEYDRSFLAMYPFMAVITNVEADHLDCYKDIDDIKNTFVQFTERVPFDGAVVACVDDVGVKDILPKIRRSVVAYGIDNGDYRADNLRQEAGRTVFDALHNGKKLGTMSIGIPGAHNVRNAMAAVAVAREMGIDFDTISKSVASFQGVKRRFEVVGTTNDGVTVIDDYAHHPGEIAATLEAARSSGHRRVIAVFQPHLYTRTRDFMDQFASSLSGADMVIVTDIYKAREEPIPDVDAGRIVDRINEGGKNVAHYVRDKNDIAKKLRGSVNTGDMVIFMGAGDIWKSALDFAVGGK